MKDEVQELTANVDRVRKRADEESEAFGLAKKELILEGARDREEWAERVRGLGRKGEEYYEQICCKDIELRGLRGEVEGLGRKLGGVGAGAGGGGEG